VLDGIDSAMKLPIGTVSDDADLPRLWILGDVRVSVRRDDQDAGDSVTLVPDLVTTLRATGQRHDITFTKLPVAIMKANGRLAAEHDEEFFAAVMEVIDELRTTWLELPQRRAQPSFA